ncbi:MAG: CDP-alcohol phosphatidyltransferase family protein [Gemmatimonadales bacterium]|jgi:phosphatidylglycerophosphate synthase
MQATGQRERRQARPLVRWPDLLTLLRVPAAAAFLALDDPGARLAVVLIAAASDFTDGIWARRIGGSRAGVVLDPICDKVFIGAAFVAVLQRGALTVLELLGVLIRDVLAILAFLGTWMLRRPTTLPARAGGKAVTVGQLLTLIAFVAGSELVRPLAWATAAMSVYAIADYGRAAWRR